MPRSVARFTALVVAAAFIASCTDNNPTGSPQRVTNPGAPNASTAPGTCTTYANLVALVNTVFGAGSPNASAALGKLDNLQKQLAKGNISQAQDQARNIVAFVQQKAASGGLPGTHAQVQLLVNSVLCFAGINPDSFLIYPSDAPQVLLNGNGKVGVSLQGNTVLEPTLITITVLRPDSNPLNTKLDVYPGFVLLTQSSALTKQAVVAVCPAAGIPSDVLARLRLGHQATAGFEITPSADAGFLDCSTSTAQSRMSKWLNALASLITPKPLYAKTFGGGIGGLAQEFSPFGPVDPELRMGGGIGGTATEFQVPGRDSTGTSPRNPKQAPSFDRTPGPRINTVVNGVCTVVDATFGTALEPQCRPGVVLKTANGTVMQNVPVGWAVGVGGGLIAPDTLTTHACGALGSTAATKTDPNGKAGVCWTLGATPGTNTVIATPTSGGDAPAGVTFNPPNHTFTATANAITPTVSATGGTFSFDGAGHAGSGTCSNLLTPTLTYSGGSVPTNKGVYTLTVTCGAGNPLYVSASQAAQIEITAASTTANVTCPVSVMFTASALTPCSATVTGPGGLSLTPTPDYGANSNVGTATASVNYAGGGNYLPSNNSTTFLITKASTAVAVTCPASAVYTGSAFTCTALATGPGLSQAVAISNYSPNNTGAGIVTATASYPGGSNYLASDGVATFQIGQALTVATVTCTATSFTYTGSALTPCTGTVTGNGSLLPSTLTYTSNIVGTATATVNYAGSGNYLPASASKTFQISYVQSGCFASPIFSVMPPTKSSQNKGSNVPIKCTLLAAQGTGVANATGNLLVQDLGPLGQSAPVNPPAFSQANVFKVSGSGNYAYGLDTSPAGFVSGHYYLVTATWSDGSKTTGYFYIK